MLYFFNKRIKKKKAILLFFRFFHNWIIMDFYWAVEIIIKETRQSVLVFAKKYRDNSRIKNVSIPYFRYNSFSHMYYLLQNPMSPFFHSRHIFDSWPIGANSHLLEKKLWSGWKFEWSRNESGSDPFNLSWAVFKYKRAL